MSHPYKTLMSKQFHMGGVVIEKEQTDVIHVKCLNIYWSDLMAQRNGAF